tara:strand:+ start:22234 stop:22926 length:693 start_codon:yes stop_codon:yes gene_type:complete
MKFSTLVFSALATVSLAACGSGNSGGGGSSSGASVEGTAYGDMSMGRDDAPVTIIEYASVTCSHCATFHNTVEPALKERIDAGDVKFIFREFPTPPQDVAIAGFMIARCAGEDKYFDVIGELFESQDKMIQAARTRSVEAYLMAIASKHGLSEQEFQVCTRDEELYDTIDEFVQGGLAMGVNATPSLFLNGERMGREAQDPAGMMAAIDAAMGIEPSPESAESEDSSAAE